MKIKDVPEGVEIICNGATAEMLSTGPMGARVNVTSIPVNSGFSLGKQIWSNLSDVEPVPDTAPGKPGIGKSGVSSVKAIKLPLTLF